MVAISSAKSSKRLFYWIVNSPILVLDEFGNLALCYWSLYSFFNVKRQMKLIPIIILSAVFFSTACKSQNSTVRKSTIVYPVEGDVAHIQTVVVSLETNETGQLAVTTNTKVKQILLSQASTKDILYGVSTNYYNPVVKLEAIRNGARLESENIKKIIPEFSDVFLSDMFVYAIDFGYAEVGDILEYSYIQDYTDIAYLPILFVPNLNFVEDFEVVVNHPEEIDVEFDVYYPRKKLQETVLQRKGVSSIRFENIFAVADLDFFPFNGFHALVIPKLKSKGTIINPIEKESYVQWYLQQYETVTPFTAEQRRLLDELVANYASKRDQMSAIYDFVRTKFRYIADERNRGGIVPRQPRKVLERRFGDCKDKSYLVHHLATLSGLQTDLLLVTTAPILPLDEVTVFSFDHMIVRFRDEDNAVLMDPTCSQCPFGSLPEMGIEKVALVVNSEYPEKIVIHDESPQPFIVLDISVPLSNPEAGIGKMTLRGPALHAFRYFEGMEHIQSRLSEYFGARFRRIALYGFTVEQDTESEVVLGVRASLKSFLLPSHNGVYVPEAPFRSNCRKILKRQKDNFSVFTDSRERMVMHLAIEKGEVKSALLKKERFGLDTNREKLLFTSEAKQHGDVYEFEYHYAQNKKFFSAIERNDIMEFCTQYLQRQNEMFFIDTVTTGKGHE